MSLKSYNFKPKRTIYDGKDDDFYEYSEKISMPKLGRDIFSKMKMLNLFGIYMMI